MKYCTKLTTNKVEHGNYDGKCPSCLEAEESSCIKVKLSPSLLSEMSISLDEIKHDPDLMNNKEWQSMFKKLNSGKLKFSVAEAREFLSELQWNAEKNEASDEEYLPLAREARKVLSKVSEKLK